MLYLFTIDEVQGVQGVQNTKGGVQKGYKKGTKGVQNTKGYEIQMETDKRTKS